MSKIANEEKNSFALKLFNYIGGALIFFGVVYFIGSNWEKLNDFFKVFVSLGAAIAAYIAGMLFQAAKKQTASTAFYLLSGLLLPIGLYITYKIYFTELPLQYIDLIISLICFIVFLVSQHRSPRILFQVFSILFATYLYFSVIEFLLYDHMVAIQNLEQYELIALGVSYILLGCYFNETASAVLKGPLFILGALIILTASYLLGDYSDSSLIYYWRLPAIISIILAFVLAVPLKAKSFLYLGSLFMVIYIVDMSTKFADVFGDLGWSLILIIAGLLFMIIGYLVFTLSKKI